MNDYENIVSTDFVDVKGVYDFLIKYIYPAIDPECVIYGNQNNITLPSETNEYCIFYIENGMQSATTIEEYDPNNELLTLHGKKEIIVRVDCYANSANGQINNIALQRAQNLQTIFKSSVGVRQLKELGLVPLYADDPNDTTLNSSDSDNYLYRWTVKLHCYLNHSIAVSEEGFTQAPKVELNSILPHDQQLTDLGDTLHVSNIDIKIKDSE